MSYTKHKDLSEVDFSEIDDLLSKLTPEEIEILNNDVDPDVSLTLFILTQTKIKDKYYF